MMFDRIIMKDLFSGPEVELPGADLPGVDLPGVDLPGVDLSGASLAGTGGASVFGTPVPVRHSARHTAGCKETEGKPRISLVPAALLVDVAKVRTLAAAGQYPDTSGWRGVPAEQYVDAIGRHYAEIVRHGPDALDERSGLPHAAHIACNCAFLLEMAHDARSL